MPELDGLDRFAARKKAAEMLAEMGLLSKEEAHENNVGFSERSEVPVEPRLSEQWFLRYPKTAEALAVVRDGSDPVSSRSTGKRCTRSGWRTFRTGASAGRCGGGTASPFRHGTGRTARSACRSESPGDGWQQDPDTLDTWFSSWLWAYETMDRKPARSFIRPTCS